MNTILFDLDGTLIDSMYVWENSIRHLYDLYHIPSDFEADKPHYFQMTYPEVLQNIQKKFMPQILMKEMIHEAADYIDSEYRYHVPLKPGVKEFIQTQFAQDMDMAVVTSNSTALTETVLNRFDLQKDIARIFSAQDLRLTKREPEIYQMALNYFQTEPQETLMFEDSAYAIDTARQLGIQCIGIVNEDNKSEMEALNVETINDFTQVI
ncbi:MAG: HAD family hydrolase [Catenisphaera adipataccumulans]|jgi:HAD superfamily hydrolase (TIGR01509 family)|uniref:HAD family hydrolase n=1 Tax=Catenisphaera adipataccumulans TaxID=700500 RepID=UPI003D8E3D37